MGFVSLFCTSPGWFLKIHEGFHPQKLNMETPKTGGLGRWFSKLQWLAFSGSMLEYGQQGMPQKVQHTCYTQKYCIYV